MEFRAIRKFNRITQKFISSYLGFCNTESVRQLERQELVPQKYVNVLQMLSGYNLSDRKAVDELLERMPQKYKEINYKVKYHFGIGVCKIQKFRREEEAKKIEKLMENTPTYVIYGNTKYFYDPNTKKITKEYLGEKKK